MATFHGKTGTVTWSGGSTSHVISFSVSVTADVAEATAMGDTYKSYTTGFKDWTAQATCRLKTSGLDHTIASDLGESATLALDTGTGVGNPTFTGTAILIDISVNQESTDNVQVTYSFQGNGTLTES